MRVVSLDRPRKENQPLQGFNFFLLILNFWKKFEVLSFQIQRCLKSLHSSDCIESFLHIGWDSLIRWKNPPKCRTIFGLDAGCWNSSIILLINHNPKNNCWLYRFFRDRFGEKVYGLCPYNPSAEEVGRLDVSLYEAAHNFEILSNIWDQN